MKCAFGENPKGCYGQGLKKSPMTRMAVAALLRELLFKTQRYRDDKLAGKNPPFDMKLEAMLPVVNGEIPLKCHAHRADDILTAVRIAKEFGVKATLDHCTDGELIADELAKEDLPVEPMPEERWLQVLERLNVINKMLAGALQGSGAYLRGQTVLIRCENPIFLEMMRSNEFTRQSLKRAIAEVTGMKYGVGPYTPTEPPAAPQSSPLEELARQAEGLGIPVTRE